MAGIDALGADACGSAGERTGMAGGNAQVACIVGNRELTLGSVNT